MPKMKLDPARVAELYNRPMSIAQVAAELGCSYPTVKRVMRENGIEPRERWWNSSGTSLPLDQIQEMYESGMTCKEICAKLGRPDDDYLRIVMKKNGIARRVGKASMERNVFWKGGRIVDRDGYILVKKNDHPYATKNGYVREHRLVMEQKLGRLLRPTEVVHHIDGNRQNNDPSNLEVFASNADHLKETLAGKIPQWTEDGKRRIREGCRRGGAASAAIRWGSETDADPSQGSSDQTQASPPTDPQHP